MINPSIHIMRGYPLMFIWEKRLTTAASSIFGQQILNWTMIESVQNIYSKQHAQIRWKFHKEYYVKRKSICF